MRIRVLRLILEIMLTRTFITNARLSDVGNERFFGNLEISFEEFINNFSSFGEEFQNYGRTMDERKN